MGPLPFSSLEDRVSQLSRDFFGDAIKKEMTSPKRPEVEVKRATHQTWDICQKFLPQVEEYEGFEQWPDGNTKLVYSARDAIEAGRHMSGWAMRNTNNHNALVLKKSCLGVLACNAKCRDQNATPLINLRPAICDKARAKQIGKPCPTAGCNGLLYLQPCEGHGGYPVTHFWRTSGGAIFFQSKGVHSHPRPVRFWPLTERRQTTKVSARTKFVNHKEKKTKRRRRGEPVITQLSDQPTHKRTDTSSELLYLPSNDTSTISSTMTSYPPMTSYALPACNAETEWNYPQCSWSGDLGQHQPQPQPQQQHPHRQYMLHQQKDECSSSAGEQAFWMSQVSDVTTCYQNQPLVDAGCYSDPCNPYAAAENTFYEDMDFRISPIHSASVHPNPLPTKMLRLGSGATVICGGRGGAGRGMDGEGYFYGETMTSSTEASWRTALYTSSLDPIHTEDSTPAIDTASYTDLHEFYDPMDESYATTESYIPLTSYGPVASYIPMKSYDLAESYDPMESYNHDFVQFRSLQFAVCKEEKMTPPFPELDHRMIESVLDQPTHTQTMFDRSTPSTSGSACYYQLQNAFPLPPKTEINP